MKLFLKILLFIFTMFITTVGEVKSSTVVNILQKETSYSFFQEFPSANVIFGNHSENLCLNGENVVAYSELVTSVKGNAAKTGSTVLNPGINMTKQGLAHTLDRHTVNNITKWAGKSKFSNAAEVPSLIKQATQQTMVQQTNGNFARLELGLMENH